MKHLLFVLRVGSVAHKPMLLLPACAHTRLQLEMAPGGEGPYALLLPLIDGDFRATLRPAE